MLSVLSKQLYQPACHPLLGDRIISIFKEDFQIHRLQSCSQRPSKQQTHTITHSTQEKANCLTQRKNHMSIYRNTVYVKYFMKFFIEVVNVSVFLILQINLDSKIEERKKEAQRHG